MALDYSKLTDDQLQAIADKDYSKLPDDVLAHLADEHDNAEKQGTELSEEALATRNDPLNTAVAGAVAGGFAGAGSKGLEFAKAIKNLGGEKGLVEPVPPTAPPKEYFAPGQKYMAKTGYGSGPGLTQEEVIAHQRAQEAPLGRGKVASKITGPASPDQILAAAVQREADDKVRARVIAQEKLLHDQAQAEYAAKQREYLKQKNALAQEKKFGFPNKLGTTKAVTGATVGYNAMDLANQLQEGDYGQAALSGTGALGAMAPYVKKLPPKLRAIGTGLSLLAPVVNRGVEAVENKATGGLVQHFQAGKKVVEKTAELTKPLWEKLKYDRYKIAQNYPDVIPPILAKDPKTGKEFLQKQLSPEALEVQKARKAAQKQIDTGNYQPFFDIEKRYYADPLHYPTAGYTATDIIPKKADTIAKYEALANDPESLARLRGAFEKAKDRPAAKDWYAMGQLEDAFIKELGPEEGRKQFKNRFADAMAATTGGADPNSNLMMAAYTNYIKNLGHEIPTKAAELPFPIGGRFVSGNMEQARRLADVGEIPVTNPKRHNFSANFLGHRDVSTLDEQMSQLWDPKMMAPPPNAYGIYQQALAKEAEKAGVQPANFQDIAWAGAKDYPGKPMMQEINEMIERTHKITGEPKEEILKGFIRADKPMYGIGALGLGASQEEDLKGFAPGGKVSAAKKLLEEAQAAYKAKFTPGFYHGSPSNKITAFDPAHEAHPSSTYDKEANAIFITKDPSFANSFLPHGNAMGYIPGSTIYPVSANLGKHWDPNTPEGRALVEDYIKANKKEFESWSPGKANEIKDELLQATWEDVEHPLFQQHLKNTGHDSFESVEAGRANVGIFDPKNIRGKFAKFDPEEAASPDFMKAKGGLI